MKHHFTVMLRFLSLAVVLLFGISGVAFAQETTGSIVGTVIDSAGGAVSNATVTVTDSEKKVVVRTVQTNETGEFNVPNLIPGAYEVTVEAPNFKKQVETGVKVEVGDRHQMTLSLSAGNISEVVTVDASQVAVELATPTVSSVVNGDQARELSLNNRNWVQLVTLAPGVSNDLADQVYVGTTNPDGQANTINIAVNGARSSQNTFTVDGADITDRGSNITIQAYPSVDSISEFRVLQSLFPAESGRSGGGQVNIVTRSGGKKFHGSAFEFIRNEAFNANNFLINASANPPFGRDSNGKAKRPPFRYNNWGWTLGGPVILPKFGEGGASLYKPERTFFFFSQEFRKDRRFTSAQTVSVPDANLRRGIFPIDVCINRTNVAAENCNVGNPGRLPAGTPLPANFLNPVAAAYLDGVYNRLPLPNIASTAAIPYGLTAALPNESDFDQTVLKFDHSFTDNWSGYYRFQKDKIPTLDGNSLFSSGTFLPGVAVTSTNSPGKTHTLQTTYVVSPKTIVEGRYTYGYGAILSNNVGLLALANTTVPVTLPFANTRDRIPTIGTSTTIVNGFTSLTSFGPYDNFSYKHNFSGSLARLFGSHTTKFGATYSIYRKNENALAGNNEGIYSAFSATLPTSPAPTLPSNITAATAANLQRWANFLVGNVQTFSQAHFDYTADLRQKAFEAYAQDEWRFRRNMTLYYGMRYSYFPSPYDKNGRLSNFVPELFNRANAPQVTGAGTRVLGTGNFCNGIIVNSQNFTTGPSAFNCTPTISPYGKYVIDAPTKDFAPRVGLAWDPFKKGTTSVRTGYGIYHEQVLVGTFLQNIGTNPPYQETVTATNTRADAPTAGFSAPTTPQGLRAVQHDWHTPYMQHWTLNIQHQLDRKTIVTVGYYGSKGTHLIGLTELNDIAPGVALNSRCAVNTAFYAQVPAPTLVQCQPNGYAFRNTAAATGNPNGTATDILILDQIRPYRGFRSIAMVQPRYDSNYHSMQVSAARRFSGASQVNLAYTWSKNMTTSPNDRTTSPQNSYDIAAEYQRATLDRRHVLNVNYVYELPWYKAQHGLTGRFLGGWQASGILTWNTGLPFSPATSNLDYAGAGLINANPAARPNLLCDPNANAPHTREQYFNTACFQANPSNTATGLQNTFGTAGRGIINGPPTKRVDFTMSKNVRFAESVRLQLRAEVFNIFNHTNFRSFVSTNVTSGSFGVVGAVRDPRTMQFGAKLSF
jgi:Carboxypeptidase regulatory-like domain